MTTDMNTNKGFMYLFTSAQGPVKIGITDNVKRRQQQLESNGYSNFSGLKLAFAIELDNYQNAESDIHKLLEFAQIGRTEFYNVDANAAIAVLSRYEGTVVYPVGETKEEITSQASEAVGAESIPDGEYTFTVPSKGLKATAKVENGKWTLLKGSVLADGDVNKLSPGYADIRRRCVLDENNTLLNDVDCGKYGATAVGVVVYMNRLNGWLCWKNAAGQLINIYKH